MGNQSKENLYCYRSSKCFNLDAQIIICFKKVFNYEEERIKSIHFVKYKNMERINDV